jgi:hypothetical protein
VAYLSGQAAKRCQIRQAPENSDVAAPQALKGFAAALSTPLSEKSEARNAGSGPVLSADDLAHRWKVSKSWVYHRAQSRQLPVLNIGGLTRFALVDIEAMERGEAVPLGVRVVVPK